MMRITRVGFSLIVAALVLVAGWAITSQSVTAGAGPAVAVDTASAEVGDTVSVDVTALNIADPGLGAWSLNVVYDPSVIEQDGCTPDNGSVCNPDFAPDTIRVSGATAAGMPGDTVLVTIDFTCSEEGTSPLTLTIDTLADGTPGAPQDIDADVINGSVDCTAAGPTPTPFPGGGGNGFPAAGGTYRGDVPGEGTVWLVISEDGQGIKSIAVSHLVTVCGTVDQTLVFDPPLDIQEPGFQFALFTFSEGAATLTMEGTFAENGTIPVNLIIDTSNVDFPGGQSPCSSLNQVIPLVLVRQTAPLPPTGGTTNPPPSGGTHGGSLPNAGGGPTLGIDTQNPVTWLVAALIGAGLAWLSAGMAGAGLASVTASVGSGSKQRNTRGFTPAMRPVRNDGTMAQPATNVDRTVKQPRRETSAPPRPRTHRPAPSIDASSIDGFRAPERPDLR